MEFEQQGILILFFKESIIQTLLDNNARTDIKNRKKQIPNNVAHNAHIQKMFQQYNSMPLVMPERQKSQVRFILHVFTSLISYSTNEYCDLINFNWHQFSLILYNALFLEYRM